MHAISRSHYWCHACFYLSVFDLMHSTMNTIQANKANRLLAMICGSYMFLD